MLDFSLLQTYPQVILDEPAVQRNSPHCYCDSVPESMFVRLLEKPRHTIERLYILTLWGSLPYTFKSCRLNAKTCFLREVLLSVLFLGNYSCCIHTVFCFAELFIVTLCAHDMCEMVASPVSRCVCNGNRMVRCSESDFQRFSKLNSEDESSPFNGEAL